jgi:hypothetical protein
MSHLTVVVIRSLLAGEINFNRAEREQNDKVRL